MCEFTLSLDPVDPAGQLDVRLRSLSQYHNKVKLFKLLFNLEIL